MRVAAFSAVVFLAGCGTMHPPAKPATAVAAKESKRHELVEPPRTPEQQAVWARAAEHTNRGKAELVKASEAKLELDAMQPLRRSFVEYEAAIVEWSAYLQQAPPLPVLDATFWLADARTKLVRIQFILHSRWSYPEPTRRELALAESASALARDISTNADYAMAAAVGAVQLADIRAELAYEHGLPKRTELPVDSEQRVFLMPMPPEVVALIEARDAYARAGERVHHSDGIAEYMYDAADVYFVYGDFKNAKARFRPLYQGVCRKDQIAYRAWVKLITMAVREGDAAEARALAGADASATCDMTRKSEQHADP